MGGGGEKKEILKNFKQPIKFLYLQKNEKCMKTKRFRNGNKLNRGEVKYKMRLYTVNLSAHTIICL